MSVETIWNSENPSFEKTKNLLNVDISWIEQIYIKIQGIREMELADNEDNKVTIPSDLQDFFWEEVNEDNELVWKVEQLKKELYKSLWLSENLEKNTDVQKFKKLFVDWLVVENIEMLEDLLDKWIDEVVSVIHALANWDVIVAIAQDIFDSFWDILNTFQNPYEWWLALWWLWLWVVWKWVKWLKIADQVWEKVDWWNLYDNPEYSFLESNKDILWEDLKVSDIVWEWNNAIILKHPSDSERVIKIAKLWETDKLDLEYKTHKEFNEKLLELKDTYKWKKEWLILEKFKIPDVTRYDWKTWIYEMEKVDWLSFKSLIHLEYYKKELSDIPKDFYSWKTDNDIGLLLEKRWLKAHPWTRTNEDMIIDTMNNVEAKEYLNFIYKLEWGWNNIERDKINPFLNILWKDWFYHKDEHWWNFMKTKDDIIYMIDFWRSKTPNN